MKKITFFVFGLAVLLITSFLTPSLSLADGMIIEPDPFSERWDYRDQNSQQAFINHQDGLEKMILSIDMEEGKESVWLFPVPAEPEKVVIDVVTELPRLQGEEITEKAKSGLSDIKKALQGTQIYTIPYLMMSSYIGPSDVFDWGMPSLGGGAEGPEIERDVTVYEHLEKEGIISEIITAKTATGLYEYLKKQGLKIEEGSISVLDSYIGKKFSFVTSWISETDEKDLESQSTQQRGVFVTFPTQEIYYPLLPTSVYGSKVVPTTIRILGFVVPELYQNIKNYTKTEYFIDKSYGIEQGYPELKSFFSGDTEEIRYTKVEINAPSKMLTEDLMASKKILPKVYLALFINNYSVLAIILLLILCSIIAGLLAGATIFREARNRKGAIKFGLIGASNCLSIIGLIVVILLVKVKEFKEESTQTTPTTVLKKLGFVALFSVLFLIATRIVIELVELGL